MQRRRFLINRCKLQMCCWISYHPSSYRPSMPNSNSNLPKFAAWSPFTFSALPRCLTRTICSRNWSRATRKWWRTSSTAFGNSSPKVRRGVCHQSPHLTNGVPILVHESWLINGLYDYYLFSNSVRCMEVIITLREPHQQFLFDR